MKGSTCITKNCMPRQADHLHCVMKQHVIIYQIKDLMADVQQLRVPLDFEKCGLLSEDVRQCTCALLCDHQRAYSEALQAFQLCRRFAVYHDRLTMT